MIRTILLSSALLGIGFGAAAQTIPAGDRIDIRTNETIDARGQVNGQVYTGEVANDVLDSAGRVAIPRGSRAELMVRRIGRDEVAIDLESVTANGRRYSIDTETVDRGQRAGQLPVPSVPRPAWRRCAAHRLLDA